MKLRTPWVHGDVLLGQKLPGPFAVMCPLCFRPWPQATRGATVFPCNYYLWFLTCACYSASNLETGALWSGHLSLCCNLLLEYFNYSVRCLNNFVVFITHTCLRATDVNKLACSRPHFQCWRSMCVSHAHFMYKNLDINYMRLLVSSDYIKGIGAMSTLFIALELKVILEYMTLFLCHSLVSFWL